VVAEAPAAERRSSVLAVVVFILLVYVYSVLSRRLEGTAL
jgi:hypothetical protein